LGFSIAINFLPRIMKKIKITLALINLIGLILFESCSSPQKTVKKIPNPPPKIEKKGEEQEISGLAKSCEETREEKNEEQCINSQEEANPQTEEASLLLEEATFAYQDAILSWEKGDFETALAALDEAYSLLLKLKLPPDSPLLQEKNDLRLIIAKRIQEIYASRTITVGENDKTIPLVENKYVLEEIRSFQTKEKNFFEEAYRRSGLYRKMILEELRKEGLPEQLSWLPLIESGFKVRALSRARALGLWQFISSTGYRFGLKRDRWIDERMDPKKSTVAAIKYLDELHSFFGDWTTALAAYNCGEVKVQSTIKSQRINYLDNFWDLYVMLPQETARFVPRFIATLLIIADPEKYGFNLPEPYPPIEFETVEINRPVKLSSLARTLGIEEEILRELNPELRHDSTPDGEYSLKVPPGYGEKTIAAIESLPRWIPEEASYLIHIVRRGETLSLIASRYRTSISSIARLNNLKRINLISVGQRLKVPVRGSIASSQDEVPELIQEGEKLLYTVKRGDSLYRIASIFNTTVEKIKKENNLSSNTLSIGQKLIIHSGKPEGAIIYTVNQGETPFEIARKFGMDIYTLLALNGLTLKSKIYTGQKLLVIPKSQSGN